MNKNQFFESIIQFRRGSFVSGVQRELDSNSIPQEIKLLLKSKSAASKGK